MNAEKKDFLELTIDEQVSLIEEALEPQVYPALRSHGGGMELLDIQGTDVLVRYYGACGGCPISTEGTLEFIEYTLQDQIDPRLKVIIVEDLL